MQPIKELSSAAGRCAGRACALIKQLANLKHEPIQTAPLPTLLCCCAVPGESLFDESDPHLVRVDGTGAPGQPRVDTDGKVVVNVDVVPSTKTPESTVKHAVVLSRANTVRILGQDLHAASNTVARGVATSA